MSEPRTAHRAVGARIGVVAVFLTLGGFFGGLTFVAGVSMTPGGVGEWNGSGFAMMGGVFLALPAALVTGITMASVSMRRRTFQAWLGMAASIGIGVSVLQTSILVASVLRVPSGMNLVEVVPRVVPPTLIVAAPSVVAVLAGALATQGFRPKVSRPSSADVFD